MTREEPRADLPLSRTQQYSFGGGMADGVLIDVSEPSSKWGWDGFKVLLTPGVWSHCVVFKIAGRSDPDDEPRRLDRILEAAGYAFEAPGADATKRPVLFLFAHDLRQPRSAARSNVADTYTVALKLFFHRDENGDAVAVIALSDEG